VSSSVDGEDDKPEYENTAPQNEVLENENAPSPMDETLEVLEHKNSSLDAL
jgi:hypothetical protein